MLQGPPRYLTYSLQISLFQLIIIHKLCYADDGTLLTTSNTKNLINKTNAELNNISWQEEWLIKTKFQKSTSTIFGKMNATYQNL